MIIWLSSYPKSGNTWLRSLIANYFFSEDSKFNFKLLNQIDSFPSPRFFRGYEDKFEKPEDTSRYWITEQEKINSSNKVFFFKTHNALCKINGNRFTNEKNTLGAIYIMRDPRNVVSSISNHYQITTEEAFSFMKDKQKGIVEIENKRFVGFQPLLSWDLHIKSWTENILYPTLIIKYEDLVIDTNNTFLKILKFIKKLTKSKNEINYKKLGKVIENCRFDNLKKMENEEGFAEAIVNKKTGKKINFFNLGIKNNYKNLLDNNLKNRINNDFGYYLKKYKYVN